MAGMKRALISVSDKTGIVEMAKGSAGLRSGNPFDRRNGKSIARGRRDRDGCRGLYGHRKFRWPCQDTTPQDSRGVVSAEPEVPKHVAEMQTARHRTHRCRRRQPLSV